MGKADQKALKNQANAAIAQNNANMQGLNTQLQSILGQEQGVASSLLPGVTAGFSDIMSGGGLDPTAKATYADFAQTGGISPASETAMRNRAGEAATSAYSTAGDKARRMMSATGGYGSGAGLLSSMARQGSQAAAQATEDTSATLAGMKQQGMLAGAGGLQSGLQTKLQALSGMGNLYGLTENQINATVGNILQNYQQTGQLNNQDMQILQNLANQPGVFDKIVGTIGTLGGAAGGIMSGIGALNQIPKAAAGGRS